MLNISREIFLLGALHVDKLMQIWSVFCIGEVNVLYYISAVWKSEFPHFHANKLWKMMELQYVHKKNNSNYEVVDQYRMNESHKQCKTKMNEQIKEAVN